MRSSARWTATVLTLAVALTAAVIAPVAADELTDAGDVAEVTEDDGSRGGSALERRRGHGHAFGLTERPADGGGLARGHHKDGVRGNGPPHGRPGGAKGPGVHGDEPGGDEPGAGQGEGSGKAPGHSDKTDPAHWHGNGKAPGHTHGTEHGPGHTHADDEVESESP